MLRQLGFKQRRAIVLVAFCTIGNSDKSRDHHEIGGQRKSRGTFLDQVQPTCSNNPDMPYSIALARMAARPDAAQVTSRGLGCRAWGCGFRG